MAEATSWKREEALRKLHFDQMTAKTRSVIEDRLQPRANVADSNVRLDAEELYVLSLLADVMIPQDDQDWRVNLAAELELRLNQPQGRGWRYDDSPPDHELYREGIAYLQALSRERFESPVEDLSVDQLSRLVRELSETETPLIAKRFFEELLAAYVEIYFSDPLVQVSIGVTAMMDART